MPPGAGKRCHWASPTGRKFKSEMMRLKRSSRSIKSRRDSALHPRASTIHSVPFVMGGRETLCTTERRRTLRILDFSLYLRLAVLKILRLRFAALGAELGRPCDGLSTFSAEFRAGCSGTRNGCSGGTRSRCASTRGSLTNGTHHCLAHGDTRAESGADAHCAPALIGGGNGNCLGYVVLREFVHIADHVHADACIQKLLQFFRQREVLNVERVEREPEFSERRAGLGGDLLGDLCLIGSHIKEWDLAFGEGGGHIRDDGVAQLAFEFGYCVFITRATDLAEENFGVSNVID